MSDPRFVFSAETIREDELHTARHVRFRRAGHTVFHLGPEPVLSVREGSWRDLGGP